VIGTPVIPDLGFPEKVESSRMNDLCISESVVRSKENGGTKYAFEGRDQPSVLLSASLKAERLQHFRSGPKPDCLALLADGQGGEEDRNDAVLSERQSIFRMPCDLENEVAVPPLEQELACRGSPNGQTAEDERTRAEAEVLFPLFSPDADQLNPVELTEHLTGDLQVNARASELGILAMGQSNCINIGQRSPRRISRGRPPTIRNGISDECWNMGTADTPRLSHSAVRSKNCPISAQPRPNGVMFGYFSLAGTTKNHEDTKLELP